MEKSVIREAVPKHNVLQLSKYDITQKIMESLVNACHRSILFCIIDESKVANQIADELNISLSAVYKTLSKLEELTLVFVEKFEFYEGKKNYSSLFYSVHHSRYSFFGFLSNNGLINN